jgi:hypothetical protein
MLPGPPGAGYRIAERPAASWPASHSPNSCCRGFHEASEARNGTAWPGCRPPGPHQPPVAARPSRDGKAGTHRIQAGT